MPGSDVSAVEDYFNTHKKDQLIGFALTLLFGPLGLLYSVWWMALILCVVVFLLGIGFGLLITLFVIWPLSMLISWGAISDYNNKVRAKGRLMAQGMRG